MILKKVPPSEDELKKALFNSLEEMLVFQREVSSRLLYPIYEELYDISFVSYIQVFIYNHVKCQLAETVRQVKCDVHGTRNMSTYLKIT